MAYEHYGWLVNEQADGPDACMTKDNGVVDTDAAWDYNAHAGPPTPLKLRGTGVDFTHDGLIGNVPIHGQPSNQAGHEGQHLAGESQRRRLAW